MIYKNPEVVMKEFHENVKDASSSALREGSMDSINAQIDALQKKIDTNEKAQDKYMSTHGKQSDELYAQHDKMCDEMEKLCAKRRSMKESAATLGFEYKIDATNKDQKGFAGMDPDDYIKTISGHGLTRSEELHSEKDYSEFFRDPKIMEKFTECMDLTDRQTRVVINSLNEAEQTSVLTALTSKLYDHIVSKVDDIDYGEIPLSKGDITKLSNYDKLRECIDLMRDILKEFKQDTSPIDEVSTAMANISSRKDLFTRAFKYNSELPIVMYNNMVLTVIGGVSYMIATCIEFIKTPNQDTFKITLDKVAYAKTKSNVIYNNLKKFNKCCKNGELDKAMEHVLQNRVSKMNVKSEAAAAITGGLAAAGAKFAAGGIATKVGVSLGFAAAAIVAILGIVFVLREAIFFWYHARVKVSDFFDTQADLLQMNAYCVQNNESLDNEEREKVASNQLKIVDHFRKAANKISYSVRKGEVGSTKEIEVNSRKMKIGDISDDIPSTVSALF